MKKIIVTVLVIALGIGLYIYLTKGEGSVLTDNDQIQNPAATTSPAVSTTSQNVSPASMEVEVVAQNLNIPWDIAFLPEGEFLVTERAGKLVYIKKNGEREMISISGVRATGESGLLGITLHPDFAKNKWLYLYITQASSGGLINRVERYEYTAGKLSNKKTIIDNIPGALYHDGGRMEFGPDGLLYITTGDATKENLAQDKSSLAGKILRLHDDGKIPTDNPFKSAVYSFGHRNPQGLAWDRDGRLWETEHGRSGVLSGFDEINIIQSAKNYGWPTIEGDKTQMGMEKPARHSGSSSTWAPASALFWDGSLFFGGLRGEALYEAILNDGDVINVREHFFEEYGRIRTVRLGPDQMFYITTSNRDGRGDVRNGDDKLLRVNPLRFR
jgi:glucose/arabinose dehydrogenase